LKAQVNSDDPELAAAIVDVREAARSFSEETAHFANAWIEKMLAGEVRDGDFPAIQERGRNSFI
jgi:hypothetical protein